MKHKKLAYLILAFSMSLLSAYGENIRTVELYSAGT